MPFQQGFSGKLVLPGHNHFIYKMHWASDGVRLLSAGRDHKIRVWSLRDRCEIKSISVPRRTSCLTFSPDGYLVASSNNNRIMIRNIRNNNPVWNKGTHLRPIRALDWSPNGKLLASGGDDYNVRIWDHTRSSSSAIAMFSIANSTVTSLAWHPSSKYLAVGTRNGVVQVWNPLSKNMIASPLRTNQHNGEITSLEWSQDGKYLVSGSTDKTVIFWEFRFPEERRIIRQFAIESHAERIDSITFSHDGQFLGIKARDGGLRIWCWKAEKSQWEMVSFVGERRTYESCIAFHPQHPILATVNDNPTNIDVWKMDFPSLRTAVPEIPIAYYRNAKVVLVGKGDIGKSELVDVLLDRESTEQAKSIQAVKISLFDREFANRGGFRVQRDIMLWDMVGKDGFEFIHQLYLDNVALGLIAFDATANDSLPSIQYWNNSLDAENKQDELSYMQKLLIATRTDVGPVGMTDQLISDLQEKFEFKDYIETSAWHNKGIEELRNAINTYIDWEGIPQIASTLLYQEIRNYIIDFRQNPDNPDLIKVWALYQHFCDNSQTDSSPELAEFETCIELLTASNIVKRFKIDGLILLRPELLDTYANAIIQEARGGNDPKKLGRIPERVIYEGDLHIPENLRLQSRPLETALLLATIKELMNHEVVFREAGEFIFPAQFVRSNVPLELSGRPEILFEFEGPSQNIYAKTIIHLARTKYFEIDQLGQDRARFRHRDFTSHELVEGYCGLIFSSEDRGKGSLTLYFDDTVRQVVRYCFDLRIRSTLKSNIKKGELTRTRLASCPECGLPLSLEQIRSALSREKESQYCPDCQSEISLLDPEPDELMKRTLKQFSLEMNWYAEQMKNRETAQSDIRGKRANNWFDAVFIYMADDDQKVQEIARNLEPFGVHSYITEPSRQLLAFQREDFPENFQALVVVFGFHTWSGDIFKKFMSRWSQTGISVIPILMPNSSENIGELLYDRELDWVYFFDSLDPLSEEFAYQELAYRITGVRGI